MDISKKCEELKLRLGLTAALTLFGAAYAGAQECQENNSNTPTTEIKTDSATVLTTPTDSLQSANQSSETYAFETAGTDSTFTMPADSIQSSEMTATAKDKSIEVSATYGLNDIVGATVSQNGKFTFWNDAIFTGGASISNTYGTSAGIDATLLFYVDESGKATFKPSTFMMNLTQEFKGWTFKVQGGQSLAGAGIVFPKSGDIWSDARNYNFYGANNKFTFMMEKNGIILEVGAMGKVDDGKIAFFFPKNANPFVRAGFVKAFNDAGGRFDCNVSYQGGSAKMIIGTARVQDNKKGIKGMGIYSPNVGFKYTIGAWTTINDHMLMYDFSHITKDGTIGMALTYDMGKNTQVFTIANLGKENKNVEVGVSANLNIIKPHKKSKKFHLGKRTGQQSDLTLADMRK